MGVAMKRTVTFLVAFVLFLVGCSSVESSTALQSENSSAEAVMPELEKTDWLAVGTNAEVFNLNDGLDNPNFEYVVNNTDTVPLDQHIAFALVSDGLVKEHVMSCEADF